MATATPTDGKDVVYHYCSMASLFQILSTDRFRLTQVRYANDADEVHWILRLGVDVVRTFRNSHRQHWNPDIQAGFDRFFEATSDLLSSRQDKGWFLTVFCGCFSRTDDSLSQWRAYADDGRGAAIGIRLSYLKDIKFGRIAVDDIDYDVESQRTQILQLLTIAYEGLVARLKEPLVEVPEHAGESQALRFIDAIQEQAYFGKNPAFAEEKEVRVRTYMNGLPTKASFFERHGVVVPFVDLPLIDSTLGYAVERIVLGPKNRAEENTSAIMMLTSDRKYRIARMQIARSSASYR